jgi:hypothetical protein
MGDYSVNEGQLALYFIFTVLSLIASLLLYFSYQHCSGLADRDHQQHIRIYAAIASMGAVSKILTEDERPQELLLD